MLKDLAVSTGEWLKELKSGSRLPESILESILVFSLECEFVYSFIRQPHWQDWTLIIQDAERVDSLLVLGATIRSDLHMASYI